MPAKPNWLDRTAAALSPAWALRRARTRVAVDMLARHFDAASTGRRTQGWKRPSTDANSAQNGLTLQRLRDAARELVRNNPYAESAIDTIAQHTVGWGILPTEEHKGFTKWADTIACDATGQTDLAGLAKLVMRAVAESGEVLARRRWRRPGDGLPLPFQLEVLEADFLDTSMNTGAMSRASVAAGNRIVHGVEFNPIGQRVAYYLFREHPGSVTGSFGQSVRVPATDVLHIFRRQRPGQVRGASWFAPVLLRFKDSEEVDDATIMAQKIAACLAVITTDVDGTNPSLGTTKASTPEIDTLEPGMIANLPTGRDIHTINPPSVANYEPFTRTTNRAIATGIGVTYEDMTGDYTNLPFSAARMSRIRHQSKVTDWQDRIVIMQFLGPVWAWGMEAAALAGQTVIAETEWTSPALPMIDPDKEIAAFVKKVRSGAASFSEALRELGYNPKRHFAALQKDFAKFDELGLVLDVDPRKVTQAGQLQGTAAAKETPPAPPAKDGGEDA